MCNLHGWLYLVLFYHLWLVVLWFVQLFSVHTPSTPLLLFFPAAKTFGILLYETPNSLLLLIKCVLNFLFQSPFFVSFLQCNLYVVNTALKCKKERLSCLIYFLLLTDCFYLLHCLLH